MRANASNWPVSFAPRSAAVPALCRMPQYVLIARAEARQFDIAEHRGQQIVEVVRHAAGQLPDHLQLLSLAKALLDLPTLGYIPDRAGQPEGMAVLVPIQSAFGDNPAHFIVRPGNPDIRD